MNSSAPTARGRAATSRSGALRPAEGDVVADRAGEQEALLRHDRRAGGAGSSWVTSRRSWPSIVIRALLRVVEAREQLDDRRLAGAGVADERHGLPGRHVEVEAVQHLGPVAVAEADALEADVAGRSAGSERAPRAVDDLRLRLEHVEDLVERGDRGQERVVELGELLHRVEEVRQVADEGERACRSSSEPSKTASRRSRARPRVAADERNSTNGK